MHTPLALVILVGLAGCVDAPPGSAVPGTVPDGYPPKIGTVATELDGKAVAWDTYDYSIGAYDASVQVLNYNGQIQFRLMGEPPGKPDQARNRLVMKAVMANTGQTGPLAKPVIEIVAGKDWQGVRLTSTGSEISLVLDSLKMMGPSGEYGHVAGQFSTTLCAADGEPPRIDRTKCQPFRGSFDSELQISGR
jgi:hypothetical protein